MEYTIVKLDKFIKDIFELSVSEQELKNNGWNVDEIKSIRKRFTALKRDNESKVYDNEPVKALYQRYNMSKIIIGFFSFRSEIQEDEEYIYFGGPEMDFIVDKKDRRIKIYDKENEKIEFVIAKDFFAFLDVLVQMCIYWRMGQSNDSFIYTDEFIKNHRLKSIELAGGEEFATFYNISFSTDV